MVSEIERNEMKLVQGHEIAALLTPCPVILVTCCSAKGSPNVLSVAWHTPLSYDPPLLGVGIDIRRSSHDVIQSSGEFGLNVMSIESQAVIEYCGNHSGRDTDKINTANLELCPAHQIRTPMIARAIAHIECVMVDQIRTGDHTFFIGRALYAEASTSRFNTGWDSESANVLLCVKRDQFGVFRAQS